MGTELASAITAPAASSALAEELGGASDHIMNASRKPSLLRIAAGLYCAFATNLLQKNIFKSWKHEDLVIRT